MKDIDNESSFSMRNRMQTLITWIDPLGSQPDWVKGGLDDLRIG